MHAEALNHHEGRKENFGEESKNHKIELNWNDLWLD